MTDTLYPVDLDAFFEPAGTDSQKEKDHAGVHVGEIRAIQALEEKLGVDGSLDVDSIDYRVNALEDAPPPTDTTASNGLTKTGDDIALGGTLIETTTIAMPLLDLVLDGQTPSADGFTNIQAYSKLAFSAGANNQELWFRTEVDANDDYSECWRSFYNTQDGTQGGYNRYTEYRVGTETWRDEINFQNFDTLYLRRVYTDSATPANNHTASIAFIANAGGATFLVHGTPQLYDYANTRNDTGATTALNFLYTDASGNVCSAPLSFAAGDVRNVVTQTLLFADQDDWTPLYWSDFYGDGMGAGNHRIESDAAYQVSGLLALPSGTRRAFFNFGAFAITFTNNDVASSAANRFAMESDLVLAPAASAEFEYDGVSSRWRLIGANATAIAADVVGGSTTQVQFNDGGALNGQAGFVFDKTTDVLSVKFFHVGTGTYNANSEVAGIPGDTPHLFEITNNAAGGDAVAGNQFMRFNAYGAASYGNDIHFCRFLGTEASPTALVSGKYLMSIGCRGWDGSTLSSSASAFQCVTTEDWNGSAHGLKWVFQVTPNGSITRATALEISSTGIDVVGQVNATAAVTAAIADAGTTNVVYPFVAAHATSGLAASGLGVGYKAQGEDQYGSAQTFGSIEWVYDSVGGEFAEIVFKHMLAGSQSQVARMGRGPGAITPHLALGTDTACGMSSIGGGWTWVGNTGNAQLRLYEGFGIASDKALYWGDTNNAQSMSFDTGISRTGPAALAFGNGTPGNASATIAAANIGTAAALVKDTDVTLAANSDSRAATQKATKAYVDALVAASDAVVYKGATDCSANPNYPAADAGNLYCVSVAGKIGGASGITVEVGDYFICKVDSTASGTQAGVGANWNVIQTNITGAVSGPASAVDGNVAMFDTTTGKLIKDSGLTLSGTNTGDQTNISGNAGTVTGLSVTAGKTLTVANSITFTGTDGVTVTLPTTNATMARTDAAQTFTGTQTISALASAAGAAGSYAVTAAAVGLSAQPGGGFTLTAANAVAGSTNVGGAAGGGLTFTAGNGARLTSGNGAGGDVAFNTGSGIGGGESGNFFLTTNATGANRGSIVITGNAAGANRPAIGFNTSAAAITTGWSGSGGAGDWVFCQSTSKRFYVGQDVCEWSGGYYKWSSTTAADGTADLFLARRAAATVQLGAADAAAPVAQTLAHQGARSGTDTNVAGVTATRQGSLGTGTASPGALVDSTGYPAASGTGQHAVSMRNFVAPTWTTLTESTATAFATYTYGASSVISAELLVTIEANDGTDYQCLTSRVRVSSVRKATSNTVTTIAVIGTDLVAESAGGSTLTCTFTAVEGSGAVTIKANAVSSLTQTTLRASFQSTSNGPGLTVAQS